MFLFAAVWYCLGCIFGRTKQLLLVGGYSGIIIDQRKINGGGNVSRIYHIGGWMFCSVLFSQDTPLKINMEHNHGGVEDHFPF